MALCPGLPGWASTRKVKPIWILLKQETVSGSGISWAICKSASRSRQITMPAPHHSVVLQAGCPSCRPTNSVEALYSLNKNKFVDVFSWRRQSRINSELAEYIANSRLLWWYSVWIGIIPLWYLHTCLQMLVCWSAIGFFTVYSKSISVYVGNCH